MNQNNKINIRKINNLCILYNYTNIVNTEVNKTEQRKINANNVFIFLLKCKYK